MLGSWQKWCRFCGKEDYPKEDKINKKESIEDQLEIINKCLMLSLLPFDDVQLLSCEECSSFVGRLQNFKSQCIKTDKMFRELRNHQDISDADLPAIRFKYGIDAEEIKYSEVLLSSQSKEESNNETNTSPQNIDPLNLEDSQEVAILKNAHDPTPDEYTRLNEELKDSAQMTENESCVDPTSDQINEEDDKDEAESEEEMQEKIIRAKTKIRDKEKPCICEVCLKPFSRWYSMNTHFLEKHRNECLPFSCSQCCRSFITERRLKLHETIHLPEDRKYIHPCPYCGKKFRIVENMRKHIRFMHTKTQTYICEECGKSFRNKSGLVAHYTSHSQDRTFECGFCQKKFKNRLTLKKHEDIHSDRVYECPNCEATFNTQSCLRGHMVIHSDVKKYKCKLCPNEYKRSNALKNHLTQHSGERPYGCEYCGMTFTNGSNCRNHKKKAHPMEFAALEEAKGARKVLKGKSKETKLK